MPNKELTMKQQAFCAEYITNNGNGTQAALKAGYKGNKYTIKQVASENLAKPYIKEYIDAHKAKISQKYEYNQDKAYQEAEQNRLMALQKADVSGANGAVLLKCKLAGLITERTQAVTSPEATAMDEQRKAEAVRVAKIMRLHQNWGV
jgi:phage terminase small subunit